jgi:hypothetical protein
MPAYSEAYSFSPYTIVFQLADDTLIIYCYYNRDLIFCIDDNELKIFKFNTTMQFFEFSGKRDEISKAFIKYSCNLHIYSLIMLDNLTNCAFIGRLKKVIDSFKLEERTDIDSKKIYNALKSLFPEQVDNSIKLAFVD